MQSDITILDAHVHLHDCFDVPDFLDHAYRNFDRAARAYPGSARFRAVLLLTESAGAGGFEKLRQSIDAPVQAWSHWRIGANQEANSLTASSEPGKELSVVAGRQIVTAERLEILALGMVGEIPDGRPMDEVLAAVRATDALCVLPWGFGKWTGRRRRVVRRILDSDPGSNFFLGDNSGRPAFLPVPAEFEIATGKHVPILPGSDPLPFASQVSVPGRTGFVLNGLVDRSRPFQEIRRILLEEGQRPNPYGSPERLLPFVRNQVAMQVRKRLG